MAGNGNENDKEKVEKVQGDDKTENKQTPKPEIEQKPKSNPKPKPKPNPKPKETPKVEEEGKEEVSEDKGKKEEPPKKEPKKEEKPKKKKRKSYVHIDVFLQTADKVYGVNSIQKAGFKSMMRGKHYQKDEEVFEKELKKYLNIE